MSRKQARELALHMLFEQDFQPMDNQKYIPWSDEQIQTMALEYSIYQEPLTEKDKMYLQTLLTGIEKEQTQLDSQIMEYSRGWRIERLSRVARSILRIALYEMQSVDDVPAGVAINEAVELAKQYDGEEVASFINGILGASYRANTENS